MLCARCHRPLQATFSPLRSGNRRLRRRRRPRRGGRRRRRNDFLFRKYRECRRAGLRAPHQRREPFAGIDAGGSSTPALADVDGDARPGPGGRRVPRRGPLLRQYRQQRGAGLRGRHRQRRSLRAGAGPAEPFLPVPTSPTSKAMATSTCWSAKPDGGVLTFRNTGGPTRPPSWRKRAAVRPSAA